ncbi:hypothetical protein ACFV5K_41105, partial [Streptomyces sp. NPDC059744]
PRRGLSCVLVREMALSPPAHDSPPPRAAVSANLGVNPSLTITAQAERAMSFWPNKGEADPRPAQGEAYERLAAVEPKAPAVPKEAFGALKLPFLGLPAVPPRKSADK